MAWEGAMKLCQVKCPLCGADEFRLRYPANIAAVVQSAGEIDPGLYRCTSHGLGQHGDIVRCQHCGMVYNNPQLDPGILIQAYEQVEDPLYLEESAAREQTFQRSLNQLHRFIQPPGKLLDVGCYTGVFMNVAAAAGWQAEGVELSSWAANIARKTGIGTIWQKPLQQLALPPESFDVITLWDVMEHLAHPVDLVKNVHHLLKPGGVLAFSTHMVDSGAARLLGSKYPFFMEMHVSHFSRTTAARLLNEQGFELLRIQSHPRILRTGYFLEKLSHKVKIPPARGLIKWLKTKNWISHRFIRIRFLGLVNIYARKRQAL
jgi:2-polyprenyl-3-methyl-5-hydroxy-6-metoxy-1,4-benzoquinol methylase